MEITNELFATHLKMFRHMSGLSPEEVEVRSGEEISSSYLRRLEKGISSPTMRIFLTLCRTYGTSPGKFFTSMEVKANGNGKGEK